MTMADDLKRFLAEALKNAEKRERADNEAKSCRWCGSKAMRSLVDNGVLGPGFRVSAWVCRDCGRVE